MSGLLNSEYIQKIKEQPCIACVLEYNRTNEAESHAHHENVSKTFANYKRMFDYGAIALCPYHHNKRHMVGRNYFWISLIKNKNFPEYLVLQLLNRYAITKNFQISETLKSVLNLKKYYDFSEAELRSTIDTLAFQIHTQYKKEQEII